MLKTRNTVCFSKAVLQFKNHSWEKQDYKHQLEPEFEELDFFCRTRIKKQ